MKPVNVLLFFLLTLASLGIASFVLPRIKVEGKALVTLPDFTEKLAEKPDSTAYFAELKKIEDSKSLAQKKEEILKKPSRSTADTLVLMQVEAMESPARFYFANDDHSPMDKFFDALDQVRKDNTSFRIIHYGDSQIEMDRISSYIREQFQRTYGGSGMGLLPALEVTPKYTVAIQSTGGWTRKLTFGGNENRARHNRYGPMGYFCHKETDVASVVITARENTSYKNRSFRKCNILVGAIDQPLTITTAVNGKTSEPRTITASNIEQLVTFDVDSSNGVVGIKFSGAKADILGISLDGGTGVSLDNIPMRGCSGTIFKRINSESLRRSYELLGVKMAILQFGGNALPGMSSKASADAYGKKFFEELKYLKSVNPNLIIFVIGPADMSVKVSGSLQTHAQLENVRDALRKATNDAGGVFWDMYEAMGGSGSMIEWVKSKPALGSPDYIHFSQKGAAKISEIFYHSLMKEYDMYLLRKKIN
jgi:lysophospholipase L1-like esterase